jgi:hypothetical protein
MLLAVGGVLLLEACGGAATEESTEAASEDGGRRSSDAEPEADPDDPDAVRPYVEDLLEDYDRVVNQIIADPSVAADRDDLLVGEYLSLFEPDSQFAEDILANWAGNGEDGIALLPYSPDHPTNASRIDGDVEVVSADEVVVPTCVEQRYVVHEGGRVTEGVPYQEQPGEIVVVRADGEWRLRRRDVFDNVNECETVGEGA